MKSEKCDQNQKPGIKDIEEHVHNIYEEITKFGHRERFEIQDVLSHIDVHGHPGDPEQEIPDHWHYVTYGLSGDGHGDQQSPGSLEEEGSACELTFRLKKTEGFDESPPKWPVTILLTFAEYVKSTGNTLNVGDHIPWNRPLDLEESDAEESDLDETLRAAPTEEDEGERSQIRHLLITEDPELLTLQTDRGETAIHFRQLVGVLDPEIKAAQSWKGSGVLDLLSLVPQAGGSYFITDVTRRLSVFDHQPYFIKLVGSEISAVGSNLAHVTALCHWEGVSEPETGTAVLYDSEGRIVEEHTLEMVQISIDREAAELLPVAARGRLSHGKYFLFENVAGEVILFIPEECDEPMVSVDEKAPLKAQGSALQIFCSPDFIYQMVEALDAFAKTYQHHNMAREIHLNNPPVTIVITNLADADPQTTSQQPLQIPVIQHASSVRLSDSNLSSGSETDTVKSKTSDDLSVTSGCHLDFPPPPPDLLEGIRCSTDDSASETLSRSKSSDVLSAKPPVPCRTSSLKRKGKSSPPKNDTSQDTTYTPSNTTPPTSPALSTTSPSASPSKPKFHLTQSLTDKPTVPVISACFVSGFSEDSLLTDPETSADFTSSPHTDDTDSSTPIPAETSYTDHSSSLQTDLNTSQPVSFDIDIPYTDEGTDSTLSDDQTKQTQDSSPLSKVQELEWKVQQLSVSTKPPIPRSKSSTLPRARKHTDKTIESGEKAVNPRRSTGDIRKTSKGLCHSTDGLDSTREIYKPDPLPKPEHMKSKRRASDPCPADIKTSPLSIPPLTISEKLLSGFSDLGGVGNPRFSNVQTSEVVEVEKLGNKAKSQFVYNSGFKPYMKDAFFNPTPKKRGSQGCGDVDLNDTFMSVEEMQWEDFPNTGPGDVPGNLVEFRPQSTSSALSEEFATEDTHQDTTKQAATKSREMDILLEVEKVSPKTNLSKDLSVVMEESDMSLVWDSAVLTGMGEEKEEKPSKNKHRRQSAPTGLHSSKDSLEADSSFMIVSDASNTSFDPDLSIIPSIIKRKKRRSVPEVHTDSSTSSSTHRIRAAKYNPEVFPVDQRTPKNLKTSVRTTPTKRPSRDYQEVQVPRTRVSRQVKSPREEPKKPRTLHGGSTPEHDHRRRPQSVKPAQRSSSQRSTRSHNIPDPDHRSAYLPMLSQPVMSRNHDNRSGKENHGVTLPQHADVRLKRPLKPHQYGPEKGSEAAKKSSSKSRERLPTQPASASNHKTSIASNRSGPRPSVPIPAPQMFGEQKPRRSAEVSSDTMNSSGGSAHRVRSRTEPKHHRLVENSSSRQVSQPPASSSYSRRPPPESVSSHRRSRHPEEHMSSHGAPHLTHKRSSKPDESTARRRSSEHHRPSHREEIAPVPRRSRTSLPDSFLAQAHVDQNKTYRETGSHQHQQPEEFRSSTSLPRQDKKRSSFRISKPYPSSSEV